MAASPVWYVWLILSLVIVGVLGFLFYYFYLLLRRGLLGDISPDEGNLLHFARRKSFVISDFVPCDCLEGRIDVMNTALPLLATDNQKILLLYARDCDKFMDLMAQFRDLLSDTCKKEVIKLLFV